jgi:hypothetical protein
MEFALLCHSSELEPLAQRLQAEGVAFRLAPPNAVCIALDETKADSNTFLPTTDVTMHHVAAACLKVSHAHLTTKVGLHPAMVTVPFAKIEEGDLVLHHGRPTQLMYQRLAAPDTLTSACGSQQGGPLVLYRKSGGHFAPLGIEDGKLLAVASDLMQKAVGF